MVQGGTETGAPDDRVVGIHGAVAPGRSLGGEPVEQGAGTQHAAVAGSTDTGDHDDVAQTGDAIGMCSRLPGGFFSGGGVEEHAAIDIIGDRTSTRLNS